MTCNCSESTLTYRVPEIFASRLAQRMWLYVSWPDRGKFRYPVSSYDLYTIRLPKE